MRSRAIVPRRKRLRRQCLARACDARHVRGGAHDARPVDQQSGQQLDDGLAPYVGDALLLGGGVRRTSARCVERTASCRRLRPGADRKSKGSVRATSSADRPRVMRSGRATRLDAMFTECTRFALRPSRTTSSPSGFIDPVRTHEAPAQEVALGHGCARLLLQPCQWSGWGVVVGPRAHPLGVAHVEQGVARQCPPPIRAAAWSSNSSAGENNEHIWYSPTSGSIAAMKS